jgi:hypothetical protein
MSHVANVMKWFHSRSARRRWLILGPILALMAGIASDGVVLSKTSGNTAAARPSLPPVGNAVPSTTSLPPDPLPGVVEPNPINPDSILVANKLTATLRTSKIIPTEVAIVRNPSDSDPPLEFRIHQGTFQATAVLREKSGSATVHIEAFWPGETTITYIDVCPAPNNNRLCNSTASHDGIRIMSTVELAESPSETPRTTVLATVPHGAQAQIEISAGRGPESFSILSMEQMVGMATLIARSLQEDR